LTTDTTAAPPAADPQAGNDLAHRAIRAAQWRMLSVVLHAGVQFGVGIVLARLLPPADFGLAALATVIVGLAALVLDLGLGSAVVQRRPLTDRHLRVAFTLALLIGAALAAGVFLAAPVAGALLKAERLPAILRVEAVLFLIAGLGVTARASLQRRLAFRQLLLVDGVSYGLGYALVAVGLALNGFGVWSLVLGAVVQAVLSNTLALALVRHPCRPLLAPLEARQLLHFGTGGALNGALSHIAFHGDNLIAGRFLGLQALGLYSRAFSLMMLPLGYAGSTVFSVMFPTLSELRSDRERFARGYLMSIALLTMVTAPVLAGMAVAAPHLVTGLYGEAWTGATLPLQIFCVAGLFRALVMPAGAVTHASGQVYAELRRQAVYTAWVLVGSLVGTRWGVTGVAVGVTTAILYKYIAMATLSLRISGVGWAQFLTAQAPGMAVAGFVAIAAGMARWVLEGAGAGSLPILIGMVACCGLSLPIAVRVLPAAIRPVALFTRLEQSAEPLPALLRSPLSWALRPRG
jgi:PST family polysaccharide transporter